MNKKSPILFNADMIRAILDGRKTQTRRIMKAQPSDEISNLLVGSYHPTVVRNNGEEEPGPETFGAFSECGDFGCKAPYAPGDLLWARETFWIAEHYSYGSTPGGCEISPPPLAYRRGSPVFYAADGNPPNVGNRTYGPEGLRNGAFAAPDPYAIWIKKPSLHMPRWASRLTLRITNVRAQRLHDISEPDAIAEGARFTDFGTYQPPGEMSIDGGRTYHPFKRRQHNGWHVMDVDGPDQCLMTPQSAFANLWCKIGGNGAWAKNPWVWVYDFEVIRKNVDEVAA